MSQSNSTLTVPEFIMDKLRKESDNYSMMCSKLTVLGCFLDKLKKSNHVYEKLCGKLFGMFGQNMISPTNLKQYFKFRTFVSTLLKAGTQVVNL